MKRLRILLVCSLAAFAMAAVISANASATVPTWFECGKASKVGKTYTGEYAGKTCEEAGNVPTGGKYELREGVGKGKMFKGKGGVALLSVSTSLGSSTVECASSKSSGTAALPNREAGVAATYKGCKMLGSKVCASAGKRPGEVEIIGLKGELVYAEESSTSPVEVKLESEAHPGPSGEIAKFGCQGLEATLTGRLVGVQAKDINVISREFETNDLASEGATGAGQTVMDKGEALMVKASTTSSEGPKVRLIGEVVEHENGGDAKEEEITPVKFVATKSGTVEELFYESSGYILHPEETSLVLGIEEQVAGKPGKVLGEGTYFGKLGLNQVVSVGGLKVPITKGKTYYLDFLPLGGAVTYWYGKSETVIYSVGHKKLVEGPPEDYEYREEAEEAPIGLWAEGK